MSVKRFDSEARLPGLQRIVGKNRQRMLTSRSDGMGRTTRGIRLARETRS
jgi:hypothetical protein